MQMIGPIGNNAIDANTGGLIGKPLPRVDAPLKTTGRAPFAAEVHPDPEQPVAYGWIVPAPFGGGTITRLDTTAAAAAPGVKLVLTHLNMPQGYATPAKLADALAQNRLVDPILAGPQIGHYGQPIACVIADTLEQAAAAAALVIVEAQPGKHRFDLHTEQYNAPKPDGDPSPDSHVGNFDQAYGSAALKVDESYTTPSQTHAPLERPATLAQWSDHGKTTRLTLHTSHQIVDSARDAIAALFAIDTADVDIVAPYIGGSFGLKQQLLPDAILAVAAAKLLKQPVKVALSRPQIANATIRRAATIQWVQIGADNNGIINAIAHRAWSGNLPGRNWYEPAAAQTRHLYAGANRVVEHRSAVLDLTLSGPMRGSGEAVGLLALESAMDELAELARIDPIELRLRNEPKTDPDSGRPFSERRLADCLRMGAEKFGWSKRSAVPGQLRDGRWLVGTGMASAIRPHVNKPASARATLSADGKLLVQTSMTDTGTGTYTILTQIAAEMLGLDPADVRVELGDSDFPATAGAVDSSGAASSGSAVFDACTNLRAKLAHEARIDPDHAIFANGTIAEPGGKNPHPRPLRSLIRRGRAGSGLSADGSITFGSFSQQYFEASYGAHFAEIGIDRDSGEIRVRRLLGVFDIGRVLNKQTTRSQLIAGMTLGIGGALTEGLIPDTRSGAFVNHDLGSYLIPTFADTPDIDAICLDATDDKVNPLKSRGAAELGACGAGAAIANAVHNACGARVRDFPITLDKILDHLG